MVVKGYRPIDRDQLFLIPVSMREWLPASDPVWVVISVVNQLDTTALHRRRRTGGVGRAGYDPDMLLALLIWGWAHGQRSSRVLQRLCARDVAFRIICAGDVPDHVTISRFHKDCAEVVEDLFTQVLTLCAQVGMGEIGVVALDGVKIASNASMSANRTEEGLRKLAAAASAEHTATDAAEDELFGPEGRGDEVPAELCDPRSRDARIAAALAELSKDNAARAEKTQAITEGKKARQRKKHDDRTAKIETYAQQRAQRGRAPLGMPPKEIRIETLRLNLAQARAAQQAVIDRYTRTGKGRVPVAVEAAYKVKRTKAFLDRALAAEAAQPVRDAAAPPKPQPVAAESKPSWLEPKRNITDLQSRLMPLRGGGWLQGFNCQAVTSSDGLIIATSVDNNPSDATTFIAMLDKAVAAAAVIAEQRPDLRDDTTIGVLLADAGYLSTDNLTAPGPDRLIGIGRNRAIAAAAREHPADGPPPPDATPLEAMAHRLRTSQGRALYNQRSHIAETPFGHAKHNLGFRRFTSRGKTRATAEFAFHAMVHNLFKAIGTGHLAPAAG